MSKTVLLIDSVTKLIVAESNPPGDLTTIENMEGQGFTMHSADHQWICRVLIPPASGLDITNPDGFAGDPTFVFTDELANLLNITTDGMMHRGSTGAWVGRTITGTPNQVLVEDGGGYTGNPTLSLPQDIHVDATPTFAGATLTGITGTDTLLKGCTGTVTPAIPKTDYAPATVGSSILKGDGSGGFTGAAAGVDYAPATTGAYVLKSNAGGFTAAQPGTDYAPATTGSYILKGDAGGFTAAVAGTDYVPTTGTGATGNWPINITGSAANASAVTITDDNSTNSLHYLVVVGATGPGTTPKTSSEELTWNPGTNMFSAPNHTAASLIGAEQITTTANRDFSAAGNWAGTNWKIPTMASTSITVAAAGKTFTRGSGWIADGFQVGMSVTFAGFVNGGNNGTFVVTSLTDTVMTCSAAAGLVNETANVTATSPVWAHATAAANATNLPIVNMGAAPSTNKLYLMTFDVVTNVAGTLTPSIGGTSGIPVGITAGSQSVSQYIHAAGTGDPTLTPSAAWWGYIDNVSIKEVAVGSYAAPSQNLATADLTAVQTGTVVSSMSKYQWTNAMVAALSGTTGNLKVCSLPARTYVKNAYIVIDTGGGTVTTLTVSMGRTGGAYVDYIAASDAKAAANTVYGDVSGDRGANLTGYDLPSFTSSTDVYLQFISTGGNLSTVTTSSGTVYLETVTLP
jgi:hypothetical protein